MAKSGFPVSWSDLLYGIRSEPYDESKGIHRIQTRRSGPWIVGPYDVLGGKADRDEREALYADFKNQGMLISASGKNAHHILLAADCSDFGWDRDKAPCVVFNKWFHLRGFHSMEKDIRDGMGYGERLVVMKKQEKLDFFLSHYKQIYTGEINPPLTELWWIAARMITKGTAIPRV